MKTVAFHNLGCKVNSYELDIIEQSFSEKGYKIVGFDKKADIYIINTCTVTNIADRKSRQMLHRAKKMNPEALVVALGCYVQTRGVAELSADGVDIIIGNNHKSETLRLVEDYLENEKNSIQYSFSDIAKEQEYETMTLKEVLSHTRAYIKIQDGCNQFCSYCLIPYARGRVRSRSLEDIISEVNSLSQKGVCEFVLTGIHLSSYGVDFREENGIKPDLIRVIEELSLLPGVRRIRLGSLEPRIVTEENVKRLAAIDKLCPHFHLSLQSGCRETLKRMNRHYSPEEYENGVKLLRKYFDNPAITTDVIVGFVGESEQEFAESRQFVEKIRFYETHVFKYSKRKGTNAAKMTGELSESVKAERSDILLEICENNKKAYEKQWENHEAELLVEEAAQDADGYYTGYTKEYIRCLVKSDMPLEGRIIRGKIEKRDNICIINDFVVL